MTDIIDRLLEKRQITETRKHRDFDVNGQTNSVYREELFNPDGLEAVQEIERLKAIASNAIREQVPMREEIKALRAENARLDWQDMKTAPTDGTFIIAALRVYSAKDKSFSHWDVYVVAKDDETGDAITTNGDDCGWLWENFEVWKPINLKAAAARAAMGESDE